MNPPNIPIMINSSTGYFWLLNKSELNNNPIKKHPEILISNVPMGKLELCILLKFIYNIYLIIDPINPPNPTNNNCLNLN